MLVRYLPVIFVLAALLLALAPLETAAQSSAGQSAPEVTPQPEHKAEGPKAGKSGADKPRPQSAGAPVNTNADKKMIPPGADSRQVRPAQAFPPERIAPSRPGAPTPQAPSRGGVQTPDQPQTAPASPKDDPRSVEERPDPGG